MDCETKKTIVKLRKLRDELCKKQIQWKNAFAIKDAIVIELKVLKLLIVDTEVSRDEIGKKVDSLLILIDPDRRQELENCNE